jgi:RHS repeat-associated protein
VSARLRLFAALAALLAAGPALGQSSPSQFTTGYRYDAAGEETGVISPDPDGAGPLPFPAVRKSYDPAGRLVKVEEGHLTGWQSESVAPVAWSGFAIDRTTATAWDAMDRKLRDTVSGSDGAAAAVTDYSYDSSGRLLCTAMRMNPASWGTAPVDACTLTGPGSAGPDRISRNNYDAADQLLKVEKGVLTPLRQDYATYEYDLDGRQTAVIDANSNRAGLRYDGLGRESCWIFPSKTTPGALGGDCSTGDFEAYGYDVAGNRTSLRKRDGVTLTYAYDALNRMIQKSVPESATHAAGYAVFYAYDLRGLETEARFGSANGLGVANSYDGFGRLAAAATSIDGTARTLTSSYDAEGNRMALTGDPGAWGYVSAFSYDLLDRLSGLIENGHPVAQLGYDAAGRRSSLGLGFDAFPSSAAYLYDPAGRLQNLTHHLAGNGNDQVLTFEYNPAGQIAMRTGSNAAYASNTALAVDRAYSVNGLNQYTGTTSGGTPSATFQYDLNGNLTSDGSHSYVYDAENRLVSQTASGTVTATLAYDPLGRLGQVAAPSGTTRFLYDGDRLVLEYNSAGTVLRVYDHGAGPDEPLIWYEAVPGGTSRRYLHADHQGSIIGVADQNGNPIAINAYDEWGIPNAGNQGRFGYTGQAWLPELGMWYYKARIYSPTLGRFLQTDPVGYKSDVNLYTYASDDPVDLRDPDGQSPVAAAAPVICAGPQAAGCAAVAAGTAVALCVASSSCRTAVDRVAHSRLGASVLCVLGNCSYLSGILLNDAGLGPETNPYNEGRQGVTEPVIVVDPQGNAIPVNEGEYITGSPNGDYQQVIGPDGHPTGVRIDRGGHRGQSDPRARGPHAHRPGVIQGGNPHLPIRSRTNSEWSIDGDRITGNAMRGSRICGKGENNC